MWDRVEIHGPFIMQKNEGGGIPVAGRKPKPTAVKKLEGNSGKRKLNKNEPVPAKGMPTCPDWLMPEAKKEWERFGQGFASMSTPTKEFCRLLMEGQIVHAGHPVLRWMAGNVVIETDAAENIKVTKAKSKEKIDGIVASIMALDRCLRNEGEPQGSVYDERGLLIL